MWCLPPSQGLAAMLLRREHKVAEPSAEKPCSLLFPLSTTQAVEVALSTRCHLVFPWWEC